MRSIGVRIINKTIMIYIGQADQIVRPQVTINGMPVSAVRMTNRVGEIPTCSVSLLPEHVNEFNNIDTPVVVMAEQYGVIFSGYPTGISCSNMNGNISAGVDLIHPARDLAETSVVVPGVTPGSNADIQTWLYYPNEKKAGQNSSRDIDCDIESKSFGKAVCDSIIEFIQHNRPSATNGFDVSDAGDKEKAIKMLQVIGEFSEETSGKLAGASGFMRKAVSEHVTSVLKRAGNSATIWDTLSSIIAAFDSYLVCMPGGTVFICPNFTGVKAQSNFIEPKIIQKFDKSSISPRSPKECKVISTKYAQQKAQATSVGVMGSATSDLKGARGTMVMAAPGWLDSMYWDFSTQAKAQRKKLMDAFAKSVLMRHCHEQKTFSIMSIPCPNVFPGTCATFQPASKIKSFINGQLSDFDKTFDGYCFSVEHYISTQSFYTAFQFKTALETDTYEKQESHPLYEGATMVEWII